MFNHAMVLMVMVVVVFMVEVGRTDCHICCNDMGLNVLLNRHGSL